MSARSDCLENPIEGGPDDLGDDILLVSAALGNQKCFQTLIDRHLRRLQNLAERVTGNVADAEEVVQDVILKAWLVAPSWQFGRAKFSTWLYRVTLNAGIDRLRRPRNTELVDAEAHPDDGPTGFDAVTADERAKVIADSLSHLPPRQRAALSAYYFGEMATSEAAARLGLSVSATESLLFRGRLALKAALICAGISEVGELL